SGSVPDSDPRRSRSLSLLGTRHSPPARSCWPSPRTRMLSEGQAEQGPVVSRNHFEIGFFSGLKGSTRIPGILNGRHDPEIALGITHDPVFRTRAIHEDGCHAVGSGNHLKFLQSAHPAEASLSLWGLYLPGCLPARKRFGPGMAGCVRRFW